MMIKQRMRRPYVTITPLANLQAQVDIVERYGKVVCIEAVDLIEDVLPDNEASCRHGRDRRRENRTAYRALIITGKEMEEVIGYTANPSTTPPCCTRSSGYMSLAPTAPTLERPRSRPSHEANPS